MLRLVFFASIAPLILFASNATACNIPVFRYALERWHPDATEVVVFDDQKLASADETLTQLLGATSSDRDANVPVNTKVVRVDPSNAGEHADLWKSLSPEDKRKLPHLVIRTELKERPVNNWHGDIEAAKAANLIDSPVRQELRRRLISGDSIVWLMLKSKDESKNSATREMLNGEFAKLSKKIKLPDGIGLPGSELYADVPLVLKFSVLEVDVADKKESYLVNLLSGFHPDAFAKGQPLLAPVFGRGRALEVLPADSVDAKLVEELTTFLCGACSCKVKGLNPGFDLLMAANWDVDLFGEDGERPTDNASAGETPLPTLITIPPGREKR